MKLDRRKLAFRKTVVYTHTI